MYIFICYFNFKDFIIHKYILFNLQREALEAQEAFMIRKN